MNLIHRFFAWNDRRRARDYLQQVCEDRVAARLKLDELDRKADRATQDAQKIEQERFRAEFFGKRDPVRSAFIGGSKSVVRVTKVKLDLRVAARSTPEIVGHVRAYLDLRGEAA